MKNLLFLIILPFSFLTFSQLQLFQGNVSINNGDTITQIHYGPEMIVELFTDIDVKNNGNTTQKVVVKVDRTNVYPITEAAFCWAGNCYGAYLDQSNDTATISPAIVNHTFEGKYYPNEIPNVSSFVTFTFIDPDQPTDSAWVVCEYGQYYSGLSLNEIQFEKPFTILNKSISIKPNYNLISIVNLIGENIEIGYEFTMEKGVYFLMIEHYDRYNYYKIFIE